MGGILVQEKGIKEEDLEPEAPSASASSSGSQLHSLLLGVGDMAPKVAPGRDLIGRPHKGIIGMCCFACGFLVATI